jgi:hypothetical protein
MRNGCFSLLLASSLAAFTLTTASADTVILKNGDKIEGKVQSETDQEVTIEFKVTASITDVRTVKKAEIAEIKKDSPDEPIFEALQAFKLGANSLPAAGYEKAIANLQAFLTRFPQSKHATEVAQQLAAFADEKRRVDAGDLKLNDRWLDKEEVAKERYQLSGQILFGQMQDLAKRNDFVGALNVFDQIEKNFPGARTFPDAVDYAKQIVPALKAQADRALPLAKQRKTENEEGLKLASEAARAELVAAQKREEQQANDAVDNATKQRVKWVPFLAHSEKSLTALSAAAATEQTRLSSIPVAKMRESLVASDAAAKAMEDGDNAAADKAAKDATQLWQNNEVAKRVTKEVRDRAAVIAAATPVPATPVPATPTPTPTPTATPKPATPPPAPVVTVAQQDEEPGFFASAFGRVVILVILAFGFAGWKAYQKLKKRANEILE